MLAAIDDVGRVLRLHFVTVSRPSSPTGTGRPRARGGHDRQLDEYFAGERTRRFDLDLAPQGTPFQLAVWQQLRRIPYGETISYGELAERVDRPGAARAVGAANGQNPIAIIIPCHRVIGADGSLTGFGGGLAWKRWLLDREQPQGRLIDGERCQIDPASPAEEPVLDRLLELYSHDFSERTGADVGDDGTFGWRFLDRYWSEPDRHAFLFRVDGRLAGFALVRSGDPHDMAEFFVLRKYRRGGVGTEAARAVFAGFPGVWQTRAAVRERGCGRVLAPDHPGPVHRDHQRRRPRPAIPDRPERPVRIGFACRTYSGGPDVRRTAVTAPDPTAVWHPTACILCSINCGIEVSSTGRSISRVRGDKSHPGSQGYTCEKALRLDHYQNAADRLTTPMRRRADGTYEPVEWDTAIAEIAARLAAVRDEHGGASIFYYGGGGQGNHLGGGYGRSLRAAVGSVYTASALSQEKTGEFWVDGQLFGRPKCHTTGDYEHAEVAVFVGKNPWQSHGFPRARVILKEIAKDPTRALIVIDPRRTESAELADYHLQVRPGTDAWCLGGAPRGPRRRAARPTTSFLADHTVGLDELSESLAIVDVARWCAIAGVDEADVRAVARRIAGRPACRSSKTSASSSPTTARSTPTWRSWSTS